MEEKEREREDLVQKMVTREKTRLVTKNTPRKDMPCFLSFFLFFPNELEFALHFV